MKKVSNTLWGFILVVVGIIFGLNILDITDINIFFEGWWTLFIIIPCFINLFKDNDKTGNIIGLVIGICLLLSCQNMLDFSIIWKLMIPFILVIIGISLIIKDVINSKVKREIKELNKTDKKEYCSTFGGQTIDYTTEKFDGCSLDAIFGGIKCDLRNAIIKENVVIDASAIFGSITILVPKDKNIKVTSVPIFGGVSDERRNKNKEGQVTIYINATCIFGGVEIK